MRDEEDDDVRGGPGWFATLVGAALLLAAGFAVGLVVGAVREEPAMLLQYVTGQTSSLPAPASAPPAAAPAAAAPAAEPAASESAPVETPAAVEAPPAVEAPAPRAPQPVIAPAPVREAAPVAAAPPSGARFAVQVGAFSQSSEAEKLEADLRGKGLPVYVQPATGTRESRWRVRVGPLPSRAEADKVAARLKSQEKLPVWILEESGT